MGWEAFEPALSRAEEMDAQAIWRCATDIPEEWYEGDPEGLDRLVQALHQRRGAIQNLITEFRKSSGIRFRTGVNRPRILLCLFRAQRL